MSISFYTYKKKIQMVDFNDVDKIVRLDFFFKFYIYFFKNLTHFIPNHQMSNFKKN